MPARTRGPGPTRGPHRGGPRAPAGATLDREPWPAGPRTTEWEPDDYHPALREPRRRVRSSPTARSRARSQTLDLHRRSRRREPWDPGWGERAYLPSPAPRGRWRFFILALALTILALGAALTAIHFLTQGTTPGGKAMVAAPPASVSITRRLC